MDPSLDRSLDEILAERKGGRGRGPRGGGGGGGGGGSSGGRRRERQDYPRDGVRKSFRDRDDEPRNLDSEWVHDKFEDSDHRRAPKRDYRGGFPSSNSDSTKIRVDNIHYELTQDDLMGLFERIGPVKKLDITYDRAGRSEGTAFVVYESHRDAMDAIREYDGANAAGQPIRLTLMPTGPRRNPFDNAIKPGRPLAERITVPGEGRSRSLSPRRQSDEEAARRGVDRYRPGGAKGSRSRSPPPNRRREAGRRPGARREGGGGGRRGGGGGGGGGGERSERSGRDGRPKKTQEELDAEMADYFGGGNGDAPQTDSGAAASGGGTSNDVQATGDDIDMIE